MSVHVLGHLLEVPNLAIPDWRRRGGREAALAGSGLRLSLLGTSLLAGLALALATLSLGRTLARRPLSPQVGEHDVSFDAMGSHVRLLIGEPGPGMAAAAEAAEQARQFVIEFDAALSRFQARKRAVRAERRPARARPRLRAAA